jgi:simple sugar transport system permease protein
MADVGSLGYWGVPLALFGRAIRVSTPFIFVSLGERLTEKSGRINLGLEGTLIMGAMSGYAASYMSGSAWLGVIAAGVVGSLFGFLHAWFCSRPRVNDIAVGIGLMLFGTGLAFFLGKPYIQPEAPRLPAIALGFWSHTGQVRAALDINALFIIGVILAPTILWMLKRTRWGLILRTVGESTDAARAMGYNINAVRAYATAIGGFLAGMGGSFLSLYYPGSWSEGLSSGQGLMAVALVIFARWNPMNCLYAALLFGAAGALAPSLQSVGVTSYRYMFIAAPYILTLVIMIMTSSRTRSLIGVPAELTVSR